MSTTKTTPETVKITLPLLDNNQSDVFVGLNGKAYLIKRGVEVEVPKGVYAILEKSRKMREARIRSVQAEESSGSTV